MLCISLVVLLSKQRCFKMGAKGVHMTGKNEASRIMLKMANRKALIFPRNCKNLKQLWYMPIIPAYSHTKMYCCLVENHLMTAINGDSLNFPLLLSRRRRNYEVFHNNIFDTLPPFRRYIYIRRRKSSLQW